MPNKHSGRRLGQIIPRGDGKYLVRYYIGRDHTGKRKYRGETIEGTYRQAEAHLVKRHNEMNTSSYVEPSTMTLSEYLIGYLHPDFLKALPGLPEDNVKGWLGGKTDIGPKTKRDYLSRIVNDVLPTLGHLRLDQVTMVQINALYRFLTDRGHSPRTVQYTHAVLHHALGQAVAANMLRTNPSDYCTPPKMRKVRESGVWTPEQARVFLESTSGHRLHPLWMLLLHAGLRPQEALALKWSDLSDRWLTIRRTLKEVRPGTWRVVESEGKTSGSLGTLPVGRSVVEVLKAHKVAQAEEMLAAGELYNRQDFIFATKNGNPISIPNVRKWWKAAIPDTLPKIQLYGARHTNASAIYAETGDIKMVQQRLRHSSIRHTADTYTHVHRIGNEEQADKIEQAFTRENPLTKVSK